MRPAPKVRKIRRNSTESFALTGLDLQTTPTLRSRAGLYYGAAPRLNKDAPIVFSQSKNLEGVTIAGVSDTLQRRCSELSEERGYHSVIFAIPNRHDGNDGTECPCAGANQF